MGFEYQNLTEYPSRGITAKRMIDALFLARKKYPQRMTLDELNSIADSATDIYREHGFKFHYVYVPPQKPKFGIVEMAVVEATLGDIQVIGKNVDAVAVKAAFRDYLNQPLYQPDIDNAILALKAQSGVDAVGYYSRGSGKGEVRLNIKIIQQHWDFFTQLDNFGSESTGENRVITGFNLYSPTDRLDQLSIGILAADGTEETNLYGYLTYRMPLWNLDNQLSFSASNNQFTVGEDFSSLELEGDAQILEASFNHQLTRHWHGGQSLSLSAARKSTDYRSIFNEPDLERDETANTATISWQHDYKTVKGFHSQISWSMSAGKYEVDGLTDDTEDFAKANLNLRLRTHFGNHDSRLANIMNINVRGQYTDDALPSFEKLLMSGAYAVRAFKPGYFASERGSLISLDWYFPWLFKFTESNKFQLIPFVFVDAAYGEKLSQGGTLYDRAELSGAGAGLEVSLGKSWSARVFAAEALSQELSSELTVETMDFYMQFNLHTH
ncbi:MAG: hypothetical protein MI976_04935, partial [Pseudomonadales bacterium]|nr:hypothetical protein [Pseudomonadales bacterium]